MKGTVPFPQDDEITAVKLASTSRVRAKRVSIANSAIASVVEAVSSSSSYHVWDLGVTGSF